MKKLIMLTLALCLCGMAQAKKTMAEKAGWRLAVQSYTFHKFTFLEALDKTAQLGVGYIEAFPGHKLGGRWGDREFGPGLDRESQRELRRIARSKGIRIVGSGVFTSDDEADWERMFRFARDMGMEYVTCEPPVAMWDKVEAMARRYKVKVAVHNHPRPSSYWHPDSLLACIATRSALCGSCADVGHWKRMGLDNIGCMRRLRGRIISLHFKDIDRPRPGVDWQHDVVWGTGVLNVRGMLEELRRQHWKGYLAIEYEYNWDNSVPDIRRCIDYFNKTADEILQK